MHRESWSWHCPSKDIRKDSYGVKSNAIANISLHASKCENQESVISASALVKNSADEDKYNFYKILKEFVPSIPRKNVLLFGGQLNAKVAKPLSVKAKTIGELTIYDKNDIGEKLPQLFELNRPWSVQHHLSKEEDEVRYLGFKGIETKETDRLKHNKTQMTNITWGREDSNRQQPPQLRPRSPRQHNKSEASNFY